MFTRHVALAITAGQEVILRNSLAWTLLYHGLPIVYYGTEQPAIAGVADQRTAMWPHYGTDTPMYSWLAQVNAVRKKYGLSHGGACRSFSTPLLLICIRVFQTVLPYSVRCRQRCAHYGDCGPDNIAESSLHDVLPR